MKKKLTNLLLIIAVAGLFHVYAADAVNAFTDIEQTAVSVYQSTKG